MRHLSRLSILIVGLGVFASASIAQQPKAKRGDTPKAAPRDTQANSSSADSIVARMLAFDKDKDGKLDADEITDERLHRLFDRADSDQDRVVTKDELGALAAKMVAQSAEPGSRGGFGPPGGSGGGLGGRGPGGPGGGPGGPPQPGQVMPAFLQESLNCTDEQKKQIAELQKEVDSKLDKILTADQKQQLRTMRERGPGGFGPSPNRAGDPGPRP